MFTDDVNILVQEQYNYEAVVKGKSEDKYRVHSLPRGGVEKGLGCDQSMMKEINEEMGMQFSVKQIKVLEFQNYQIDNNKFMRIYKILVTSKKLQSIADKAKIYQATLPQKFLKGGKAYQEVYTSYIISLNQFLQKSKIRDTMFIEEEINAYWAHSYFTDNSDGLMQFIQSKGKENEGINGKVLAAPVVQIKYSHHAVIAGNRKRKTKRDDVEAILDHAVQIKRSHQAVVAGNKNRKRDVAEAILDHATL
jgi:ADP-ribose pyrophosphatase YjhB (NUDIX family)